MGRGIAAAATAETRLTSTSRADALETIVLGVDNMHCGACIRQVEDALLSVAGVAGARVNLSERRVVVTVDSRRVTSEDLIEKLDKNGFAATDLDVGGPGAGQARSTDLLRRLGVAGFAAMNIMLLSVSVWSGSGADMDAATQSLFHWLSALIALPAVAYSGEPFFRSAVQALRVRRLNMDVPISLGVILATAMSLYQTTIAGEQVYFDAAVTLLAFLLLGRLLDERMRARASSVATNLLGLRSAAASVVLADGRIERVPIKAVEPGMRVLTAAGERIAVDGVVVQGCSEVDQSLITGESAPQLATIGSNVYSGTINLSAPMEIEVLARDTNSLLSEIARLMLTAEQGRGRYVRLADRAARIYAPAVHVLGLATFVGWIVSGFAWTDALTAAIAVLIITCPCALALAVPAVQVAAASRLFAEGIILKSPDGLERLAEVDTIIFDKTGTLTAGLPSLLNGDEIDETMLRRAAAIASASRHPYARAVVASARAAGFEVATVAGLTEVPGCGLAVSSPHGEERLGSAEWCGVTGTDQSGSALWFRPADGEPVAFRFAVSVRDDCAETVNRLRDSGYALEVLSGDAPLPVQCVAAACGIEAWRAGEKPAGKVRRLEELRVLGRKVLMVGDGLNDAPALAFAHASLSPAAASDISQTASDAIFQGARLAPVVELLGIARRARRMSLQNFAVAIGYNIVFVPLAMVGLVTPLLAAIAMSASSITVTANAVRLSRIPREIAR